MRKFYEILLFILMVLGIIHLFKFHTDKDVYEGITAAIDFILYYGGMDLLRKIDCDE
jgi:hypothetical protein